MFNKKSKLMLAGFLIAGALAALAPRSASATPPKDFTSTPIVGPVVVDDIQTIHEARNYGAMIMTRGLSDIYVTHLRIAPGGHGGWHSHPGPSIITVRSGTATFYDECSDFQPATYDEGTGFVEDAECVHLLANEGAEDLEVIVVQIVPHGAPRRIDEPAP